MRILFSTASPARHMLPPRLAAEQINCGPDWADARDASGRLVSLSTPVGDYDLAAVVARLSSEERPDAVVCLVDAGRRNMPRNIAATGCPVVLLVADTHHMEAPVSTMVRYAASEPFARVVLLYDRHHAAFFRQGGVRDLFWFPGLTFPHEDEVVLAARCADRVRRMAYVGQVGRRHPRRTRLIEAIRATDTRLDCMECTQEEGLQFYGASLAGFNASLNGDFNLRAFEIIASGAALLTDRLSPESGLDQLWREGAEFAAYSGAGELREAAVHLVANPTAARKLGDAGARWFDTNFTADRRRAMFERLVFDGVQPWSSPSCRVAAETASPLSGRELEIYEWIQERHRTEETVRVALQEPARDAFARAIGTLPRAKLESLSAATHGADVAIVNNTGAPPKPGAAERVWCMEDADGNADRFEAAGYARVEKRGDIFRERLERPADDGRRHVVLYTDDPDSGGVAQYNHTLLCALADSGYRVTCVQSRSASPLVARQRALGVKHRWISFDTIRGFERTLREAPLADALFEDDPAALVIFSDCCPFSNLAAREAARRTGTPFIDVVGFVSPDLAEDFASCLPALSRQYADARAVVAVSEENRWLLVESFCAPPDKTQVIHYGRPETFFKPRDSEARARIRAGLNLPDDAVLCLTTARLLAVKGYHHQLEAMVRLKGDPAQGRLHFAWLGEGPERTLLEKAVATLGLEGRVHLPGHRWDVAEWYDAADIFVLTSHYEGMPLCIMEAMAKGLPVAATAVSGVLEEMGPTGRLLPDPKKDPAKTADALARTLARWALDPALREETGRKARERAEQMFREETMLGRTLGLVETIAGNRPRRAGGSACTVGGARA